MNKSYNNKINYYNKHNNSNLIIKNIMKVHWKIIKLVIILAIIQVILQVLKTV